MFKLQRADSFSTFMVMVVSTGYLSSEDIFRYGHNQNLKQNSTLQLNTVSTAS